MGLHQHRPGQSQQGLGVGEDPDDVGAALDLLVEPLRRVVDQSFFQCETGNEVKASSSSALSRSIRSSLGNWRPSIPAIMSSCSWTWAASGWAKMVRIAAATISAEPLGTWASTFLRKWTRQRWTAARP